MTSQAMTQHSSDTNTDVILMARGLTKAFGGFRAVDNLDLTIRKGSIHALIGPNGAGKSTVFALLTKFHTPTAGRITLAGEDITNLKPADVVRRRMVRSFQISAIFPHLTVLENVRVALQRHHGLDRQFWRSSASLTRLDDEARSLLASVGLDGAGTEIAANLSYGRKRALEIATTLALDPKVLLLDEPMAGMGAADVKVIARLIAQVGKGRTIVMVEHNLNVVEDLCDRVTVLARGRLLAEGDFATIRADKDVRDAYIGAADD
jgi:branched-chain amino acid transport system ATP-binding protein